MSLQEVASNTVASTEATLTPLTVRKQQGESVLELDSIQKRKRMGRFMRQEYRSANVPRDPLYPQLVQQIQDIRHILSDHCDVDCMLQGVNTFYLEWERNAGRMPDSHFSDLFESIFPEKEFKEVLKSYYIAEENRENRGHAKKRRKKVTSPTSGSLVEEGQETSITPAFLDEYECDRRLYKILQQQFFVLRLIGSGTYGEVYECWDHVNKKRVALKRLIPGINNARLNMSYTEEAQIIKRLSGKPNVVNLVPSPPLAPEGHFVFEDQCALVLTYLCHDITKDLLLVLNMDDIRHFMRQLLVALQQVHGAGVVHSDVKLQNILFERATGNLLLVDFGLASRPVVSHATTHKDDQSPRCGTRGFRAPEVVLGSCYQSFPVDIWSAGVVMMCLLSRTQQPKWLQQTTDAQAVMEFRCLRSHISQMDEVWSKTHKRYHKTPVDKLKALIMDHRIVNIDIGKADMEAKIFFETARTQSWTWRKIMDSLSRDKDKKGCLWTAEEDPMWDLLNRLLDLNPDSRITAEEALQHKWFARTIQGSI